MSKLQSAFFKIPCLAYIVEQVRSCHNCEDLIAFDDVQLAFDLAKHRNWYSAKSSIPLASIRYNSLLAGFDRPLTTNLAT